MTVFRHLFLAIIFIGLNSSCAKNDPNITVLNDPANFKYIIYYNNDRLAEGTKSWDISRKDFALIDSLLRSKSLKNDPDDNFSTINIPEKYLENYFRQYIPYIDKNGDRIVYINAACHKEDKKWETSLLVVRDGGDCYWQVKVNVDKKVMYEFGINSIA